MVKKGEKAKAKGKGKGKGKAKERSPPLKRDAIQRKSGVALLTPHKLSPELAELTGHKSLTHGEVTKYVWVYIKAHKLQDPEKGQFILPDQLLGKILGSKDRINMMVMTKKLQPHIL